MSKKITVDSEDLELVLLLAEFGWSEISEGTGRYSEMAERKVIDRLDKAIREA